MDFVDKAYAEICDHSLCTLEFCYIEKLTYIGVLGNLGSLYRCPVNLLGNSTPTIVNHVSVHKAK